MLLFTIKFFITNIIFSFILSSFLMRLNKSGGYTGSELMLYSLGLGPVFTTLILYYTFLLIPHHSNVFYLVLILSVYFLIAIIGRKYFKHLLRDIQCKIKKVLIVKGSVYNQTEHILLMLIIIIPLSVYLVVYLTRILPQPLVGHDILDYGITGRMLFEEKSLAPIWVKNFAESGYSYRILHAPSFSLLLTWEELINSFFYVKSDFYFRSISVYYGLLILSVQYYWAAKQNKWLAVLSALALLSGVAFLIKFFSPHIDTYRILFFIMSLIYLAYAVKKPDYLSIILFGIFSGFAAFAHRIGVVLVVINCVVFFIILDSNFKTRLLKTAIVIILVLAFGGSHYIFDLIWGRGAWIKG